MIFNNYVYYSDEDIVGEEVSESGIPDGSVTGREGRARPPSDPSFTTEDHTEHSMI